MQGPIDDCADIEVSISRLQADEQQVEELKEWIKLRLRETLFDLSSRISRIKGGGKTYYEITFRCDEPNRFNGDALSDKLHDMLLVGWDIRWTFVPGTRKTV